jgi:glutamyl-tRNA reductase
MKELKKNYESASGANNEAIRALFYSPENEYSYSVKTPSFNKVRNGNAKIQINQGTKSHEYQVALLINILQLPENSKVLLVGAGDIAETTLNLLIESCNLPITMVNQTYSNSEKFNGIENVRTSRLENLPYLIKKHDVIISTIPVENYLNAGQASQIEGKYIFDLTVPSSLALLFGNSNNIIYDLEKITRYSQESMAKCTA